jgi:hypothetical protein
MQSRPTLTIAVILTLAVLCAASVLPVISSGQVEQAVSTGSERPPQTGRVNANGASVRRIGFRDGSNRADLNPVPGPNPAVERGSPFEADPPFEPTSPQAGADDELGPIPLSALDEPVDQATQILERARERLIKYESIRAELVETVALGGHQFRMKGTYLQGMNLRLRLDCQVQVGSTTGKLTEVCDGQILWTWQQIGEKQRVTRRNVRQIERAASSTGMTTQNLLLAELGFGGLPALVASLQKSLKFDRVAEQDVDGLRLVVMDGVWKPEVREQLAGGPTAPLPSHIPDRVRLYLQKDKLFPRRILYLKQGSKPNRFRPLVSLDFVNVVWDGPLDETAFQFTPPENVRREDITQEYIRRFTKKPESSAIKSDAKTQRP